MLQLQEYIQVFSGEPSVLKSRQALFSMLLLHLPHGSEREVPIFFAFREHTKDVCIVASCRLALLTIGVVRK